MFQQIGAHFNKLGAENLNSVAWEGGQLGDFVDFGGNLLTKGQVAGQIASHAAAGGVISTLSGGKFGHGFFSAGFTKGAGTPMLSSMGDNAIGATLASAVIGGTASVISGGKFANGARTAAYQTLFNGLGDWFKQQAARYSAAKRYSALNSEINRLDKLYKENPEFLRMEMGLVGGHEFSSEREFRQAYITLRTDMTIEMVESLNTMNNGGEPILWNKVKMKGHVVPDAAGIGLTAWPLLFIGPQTYTYNYSCSNRGCALGELDVE